MKITAIGLGQVLAATGCASAVIVTDAGLALTPVVAAVRAAAADAGIVVTMFSGVHANPTTDDLAAGADVVAGFVGSALGVAALVAVGGGSSIDAAKGIALAAVNGRRGRELDYRGEFAARGLPIVAVPTTAGTGAETNAFGLVTDPGTRRKFYVGHESTMPAAAILDPELTLGLPPRARAATGFDVLTHAVESYLSIRANPWADGIALQVIKMIAGHLASACADGTDLEARSQMLLAAHMAGIGMATTGLGLVHAIGHALGGRYDIAHGVTLAMVLPKVLRFSEPVRSGRLAAIAFALDVGDAGRDAAWNSAAAIDPLTALRDEIGLAVRPADFGLTEQDFEAVAADALDDEVLGNAPRRPAASEIEAILAQALGSVRRACGNPLRLAAARARRGGARYVHYVFANPVNGRRSPRSKLTAIALVVVGAVVLSTATVLGLHWATASSRKAPSMQQAQGLGFTKLDRQAPPVLLPSLRGSRTVSITKLAGKPIVLNFWASTCEVCKSETPALASVARTLGGEVTFVGIDSVDRQGPAMAFITKYHVPYPVGFDPQGTLAIKYGVVALPVTFFLSPSGKTIMGENIGALTRSSLRTILHNLYGTS